MHGNFGEKERRSMKTMFQVMLMITLSCGLVFGQAASKAVAATSNITTAVSSLGNSAVNPPFVNAITTTIKPPAGQSDLLVTFSALTTLVTTSLNVDASTAAAVATLTAENTQIQVRLLVDGIPAFFAAPVVNVPLDSLIRATSLQISPATTTESLGLLVQEGGVRSLTWAVPSVGNGEHTVTVQFRFLFSNSATSGSLSAITEILGPRTLVVEGVNIKTPF